MLAEISMGFTLRVKLVPVAALATSDPMRQLCYFQRFGLGLSPVLFQVMDTPNAAELALTVAADLKELLQQDDLANGHGIGSRLLSNQSFYALLFGWRRWQDNWICFQKCSTRSFQWMCLSMPLALLAAWLGPSILDGKSVGHLSTVKSCFTKVVSPAMLIHQYHDST